MGILNITQALAHLQYLRKYRNQNHNQVRTLLIVAAYWSEGALFTHNS